MRRRRHNMRQSVNEDVEEEPGFDDVDGGALTGFTDTDPDALLAELEGMVRPRHPLSESDDDGEDDDDEAGGEGCGEDGQVSEIIDTDVIAKRMKAAQIYPTEDIGYGQYAWAYLGLAFVILIVADLAALVLTRRHLWLFSALPHWLYAQYIELNHPTPGVPRPWWFWGLDYLNGLFPSDEVGR